MPMADAPTLDVFYAAYCQPCQQELPALRQAAGQTRLVIRVLGNADQAKLQLGDLAVLMAPIPADQEKAMLRQAGDRDGILPYARSVKEGRTCRQWRGILTWERIQSMVKACL